MQATQFSGAVQKQTTVRKVGATAAFMAERAAVIHLGAIQQRRTDERDEMKAARIVKLFTMARLVIPAALIALIIGSANMQPAGTLSDKTNLGAQLFPDTPTEYFPARYVNQAQSAADRIDTF